MIKLFPVVEFYITNVCNLECRGCNRFNDEKFKGHQLWDDYAEEIEHWAARLEIPRMTIIGGEPTLNPDLEKWAVNLRRLWPDSVIMIQTNGTYQRPEYLKFWDKYRVGFGLSLHDPETAEELKEKWKHYAGPHEAYVFHQSTIIKQKDHWLVHSSDQEKAFNCCDMKHDHTIHRGKLYKCPAMSGLSEFQSQFDLRLDSRQQQLLDSYQPLSPDCTEQELENFVNTKDQSIPQCEFCPENLVWTTALGEYKTNLPKPVFDITPINENDLDKFKKRDLKNFPEDHIDK